MASLADKLTYQAPSTWVEVGPPRGVNPEPLLRRLSALVGHVDAINLTDNALGNAARAHAANAAVDSRSPSANLNTWVQAPSR